MQLGRLASILLRYGWLAIIPPLIAAVFVLPSLFNRGAASGGYSASFRYSAAQDLSAIPRTEGDYQDIWLASHYTIDAFTDWVRGNQFLQNVIEEVGRRGIAVQPGSIGIAADNAESIGQVFLSHPDEATLAAVQEAAITVLSQRSGEYFAQLGGVPATVTIIDRSPVSPAPPPLTNRFAPLLQIAVALLAGIGLAALAYLLDPVVRDENELETLGLRVVGQIPRQ